MESTYCFQHSFLFFLEPDVTNLNSRPYSEQIKPLAEKNPTQIKLPLDWLPVQHHLISLYEVFSKYFAASEGIWSEMLDWQNKAYPKNSYLAEVWGLKNT